jgi:hypothetical protein
VRAVGKNDHPVDLTAIADRSNDAQPALEERMGMVGDTDLNWTFMILICIL